MNNNLRMSLLVHLLMNTPHRKMQSDQESDTLIFAHDFLDSLMTERAAFKNDRWNIISELISVRERVEMYEAGDVGKFAPSPRQCFIDKTQVRTRL